MRNTTTQARLREALALHGKTISIATAKLKGEILMNAGSKARIAILSSIGNNLVEQAQGAKNKLAKFDINLSATTRAALNKQLQALRAPSLGCPDKKGKKKKQCGCDDTMLNGLECLTPQQEISIGLGKTKEKSTYELITDMVVKKLETEKVLPWQKPWISTNRKGKFRAKNFASKKPYSGVNAFILNYLFEYDINYYLSLKQIKKLKGKLVEGAERVPIVYYTAYYKNNDTDQIVSIDNYKNLSEDQQNDYTFIQAIKHYWAYNAEFIEGIDWGVEAPEPLTPKEQIETAEAVFNSFKKGSKLIIHKKRRAFYNPNNDTVNMPPIEMFKKEQEYYSTLYHEYIHSTAHKTRLNRLIGDKFGSKNYALEELVAELGASFLCGEAGILYFTLNNSVSYLKGWKESLLAIVKKDSGFIFKAASEAQKAVEYLLQKEPTGNARKYLQEKDESKLENKKATLGNTPQTKPLPNGVSSLSQIMDRKFNPVILPEKWNTILGQFEEPTSIMFHGAGGRGKSGAALTLANDLSKIGRKILYASKEQYHSPTLRKLVESVGVDVNNINIHFSDTFESDTINPSMYNWVVIDSKDSFGLTPEQFAALKLKYPRTSWMVLFQNTKDDNFRGEGNWQNEIDTMLNVYERGKIKTGAKNRWDTFGEMTLFETEQVAPQTTA